MSNKPYLENEIKALKYQLLIEKQKHKKTKAKLFNLKNISEENYERLKTEFAKYDLFVFKDLELFLWMETTIKELQTKIKQTNEDLGKFAFEILELRLNKRKQI